MSLSALDLLHRAVADAGFTFVHAPAMRALLEQHAALEDWSTFARSWDRLEPDAYLARTGRVRRRRHALFRCAPGRPPERLPHGPHYQTLDYNPLQGGIERWFAPIEDAVATGASLRCVLGFAAALFDRLAGERVPWRVEVHQFRIEAAPDHDGEPTPEGRHRDGVDYVLVLLIDRVNIERGTTSIHRVEDGREVGSFTLTTPFDAAIVDDHRVLHGVTPVHPLDPSRPAQRDVLVVTFKRDTGG
ncbi:MAG TPA: 2OG-Fe dioxygenase family protein [Lysobacter sp.]|nr:2OG-Fe dioxygenase family protein [Lysobacter sp.]